MILALATVDGLEIRAAGRASSAIEETPVFAPDARLWTANDANVLQITAAGGAETLTPSPTTEWGLHLLDANIALGNLIGIVKTEAAAFVASEH